MNLDLNVLCYNSFVFIVTLPATAFFSPTAANLTLARLVALCYCFLYWPMVLHRLMQRFVREYDSKNKAFGNEIDRIFLQVKQEEQGVHGVESQIEAAYANNQAKINAMDPNKLRRYQELVQNSMQLQER